MAMTPNSTHTPSTSGNPPDAPVLNIRRPAARSQPPSEPVKESATGAAVNSQVKLPPTAMRLPNLANTPASEQTQWRKIASIAHWVAIVIGGIIACLLIFTGRGRPLDEAEMKSETATTSEMDKSPQWKAPPLPSAGDTSPPAWNPPPLPSAGESVAPKWTPPAAAPAAEETKSPVAEKPAMEEPATTEPELPAHEPWPQHEDAQPAAAITPEVPAWEETSHNGHPHDVSGGPVARTAQREAPSIDPYPAPNHGDNVQPLGITVPVPQ